jgi:predicted AAA+ superfamily ATPase
LQTDTTLIAKKFPKLDLIDVRKNELEDVDEIIQSLKDCEELSALLLDGNPLCVHL